jgi:hypothetical protein
MSGIVSRAAIITGTSSRRSMRSLRSSIADGFDADV